MSDKEKDRVEAASGDKSPDNEQSAALAKPSVSVGAYAPALSELDWAAEKKPWNASPQGRLAIRVFSRGVMGSAFFAVGGMVGHKWLQNYDHNASVLNQKNPLTFVSKLIDIVAGAPIEATVKNVAKVAGHEAPELLAKKAVTFRPSYRHSSFMYNGRTLGHEMSSVTFDFFCASVGDAWARDLAGLVDPNAKKEWMKDGHIQWPSAVKQAMKSTWRYVSLNGGEDWAVALPYVYFMKAQRSAIEHYSPGFMYDFDRHMNGGSSKFTGGKFVGDYNRAGAFDFQTRFTMYNMGTVAYREMYAHIADRFHGKHTALYGAPDKEPEKGIINNVSNGLKWIARSVVKGGIYMTPVVPFFWATRPSQYKYKGAIIDPQNGVLLRGPSVDNAFIPMNQLNPEQAGYAIKYNRKMDSFSLDPIGRVPPPGAHGGVHNPFVDGKKGLHNFAGHMSDGVRRTVTAKVTKADNHFGVAGEKAKAFLGIAPGGSFAKLSNSYVNSAISYTPYMYAKAEAANLWDDGKMDMSIERAIDGATKLNFGEFKAGVREIGRSILHRPLTDPEREKEAQRRIEIDESAADDFTETKSVMNKTDTLRSHLKDHPQPPSWRDRIVAGRPEDKPEVGANEPTNYAEKEEMRKALEELQPPTNSIN